MHCSLAGTPEGYCNIPGKSPAPPPLLHGACKSHTPWLPNYEQDSPDNNMIATTKDSTHHMMSVAGAGAAAGGHLQLCPEARQREQGCQEALSLRRRHDRRAGRRRRGRGRLLLPLQPHQFRRGPGEAGPRNGLELRCLARSRDSGQLWLCSIWLRLWRGCS